MRVDRHAVAEGFEWVLPVEQGDHEVLNGLDGSSRARTWHPIRVSRLTREKRRKFRRADMPWYGENLLVLREKTYQTVRPLLSPAGEFLPVDLVDGTDQLWIYNVLNVVDALDEDASELVRFSSGRIMRITRHVFFPSQVANLAAFRVPQVGTLFVAGEVTDAIAPGLVGHGFEPVWSSADA